MYYLAGQVIFIMCLAVMVGVFLGWWSRGFLVKPTEREPKPDEILNPFSARTRLEQCHRDNAGLRRELQQVTTQLEQLQRAQVLAKDKNVAGQLQAMEAQIQALLEDLQLREDTIAVLETELEQLRR